MKKGPKAVLDKNHRELRKAKGLKSRQSTRIAPIVWEMLRRHERIVQIRSAFEEVFPKGQLHRLLSYREPRTLIHTLGLEIEAIVAVCGNNAWVTERQQPNDPYKVSAGNWPLEHNLKLRFEQLMPAYSMLKLSPTEPFSFRTSIDIVATSLEMGKLLRGAFIDFSKLIGPDNPFSCLSDDPVEQWIVPILMRGYRNAGFGLALEAIHAHPLLHPTLPQSEVDAEALIAAGDIWDFYEVAKRLPELKADRQICAYLWRQLANYIVPALNDLLADMLPFSAGESPKLLAMEATEKLFAEPFHPSVLKEWSFSPELKRALQQYFRAKDPLRINLRSIRSASAETIDRESPDEQIASQKKRAPNASRRPRPNQLEWIFRVETDDNDAEARKDYNRALAAIKFPLLPCVSDPHRLESLEKRLASVIGELRQIWPLGAARE